MATTGGSYLEILRLLQFPEEDDHLSLAFGKLNRDCDSNLGGDVNMLTLNEDADQVSPSFFFAGSNADM